MAPKSKTVACRIHQSVSTMLDNLICYLNNENAFRACEYETFDTNESKERFRLCDDRIDVANIENIVESQNISNFEHLFQDWNVVAVIGHPIDRLLAGFLDKCIRDAYVSHPFERTKAASLRRPDGATTADVRHLKWTKTGVNRCVSTREDERHQNYRIGGLLEFFTPWGNSRKP
ncbi:sulfotransferase family domain-containing protein [Ditylenchus destructor]|uniref:Sulfotransferase family domain-containing protein n=1 Tax=Ditylenchus destructor TaxID=166010 RepID=A0AAD4QW85_9BILA|nr:sulfotransferase family domain-containing protein [Ditylenchus destructor]